MLKKLILENWKSFRYAELPIDPLTILVGANASGKSNCIEALNFLHSFVSGHALNQIVSGNVRDCIEIRGGGESIARFNTSEFALRAWIDSPKDNFDLLYSIEIEKDSDLRVKSESLTLLSLNGDYQHRSIFKSEFSKKINPAGDYFSSTGLNIFVDESINPSLSIVDIHSSVVKLLSTPFRSQLESYPQTFLQSVFHASNSVELVKQLSPQPTRMRCFSPLSKTLNFSADNIAGFIASLPDEDKENLQSTITRWVSKLATQDIRKIWVELVGRQASDAMLYGEEIWGNGEVVEIDARSMSDGTLRFIAILTALLTYSEGSLMVIEDIDDGLHPSRATLLLQAIREIGEQRNIDVLVTTHNPALLDSLEQEYLPFIVVAHRDSQTGESLLTPLDKIENLPKLLASASLGDLATQGAIERNLKTEVAAP